MPPQKYLLRSEFWAELNRRVPGALAAAFPVNLITDVNGRLPLSNLAAASATARILARITAGSGDWEEATLSEVLDLVGSPAQGDILYRGASAWSGLAADTDGKVLTTHGAAADPTWETPSAGGGAWMLLEQHTASSSAQLDFTTSITSTYDTYRFIFSNIIPATNGAVLHALVSYDGGATFDTTGVYSYSYMFTGTGQDTFTSGRSTGQVYWGIAGGLSNTAAFGGATGSITLFNPLAAVDKRYGGMTYFIDTGGNYDTVITSGFTTTTTAATAVRFVLDTGDIASGTIYCFGIAKS